MNVSGLIGAGARGVGRKPGPSLRFSREMIVHHCGIRVVAESCAMVVMLARRTADAGMRLAEGVLTMTLQLREPSAQQEWQKAHASREYVRFTQESTDHGTQWARTNFPGIRTGYLSYVDGKYPNRMLVVLSDHDRRLHISMIQARYSFQPLRRNRGRSR